ARGHALICGRQAIDDSDVALVSHVAISSIPGHLRPLVRALRDGTVSSTDARRVCAVSAPTARNYLKQLQLLGIANVAVGSPKSNEPDTAALAGPYAWMRRP